MVRARVRDRERSVRAQPFTNCYELCNNHIAQSFLISLKPRTRMKKTVIAGSLNHLITFGDKDLAPQKAVYNMGLIRNAIAMPIVAILKIS